MPYAVMAHEVDPVQKILDEIGPLNEVEIFNNQLLCAVYVRPQKTQSGIYLTDKAVDEDRYQGKVGLVVKKGPQAFEDPEGRWFKELDVQLNDWVIFKPSDGWSITVNGVLCRILDDTNIRGRIQQPDQAW